MSSKNAEKEFNVDLILKELGDFGMYQFFNYILICIPICLTAMYTFNYVYTAADIDYRCKISECESQDTFLYFNMTFLNYSIPYEGNSLAKCKQFKYINRSSYDRDNVCSSKNFDITNVIECSEFVFQDDEKTIVSEWNLTCRENEWKLSLVGTVNNIGQFVALPLAGYISDSFGRRTALILASVISGVMGLIKSFSFNYEMLLVCEFIESALGSCAYVTGFILGMELVGPKRRVIGSFFINCFYILGSTMTALIAMATKEWRVFLRWAYIPCIPIIIYFWLIPESIRWLVAMGRQKEAATILLRAGKMNNIIYSDKANEMLSCSCNTEMTSKSTSPSKESNSPRTNNEIENVSKKQNPLISILKSPVMLVRLMICSFCWMGNAFVYFGLMLNSVSIDGNKYVNFIILCVIEIPAYIVCSYVMNRFGRKKSLCGSLLLNGLSCFAQLLLTPDTEYLKIYLFILGKFSITISFTVLYMYTTELFPTDLRTSLLGFCSMLGRIGSIVAPQTPLLGKYFQSLPMILFGSTAVASGLMILPIPETLNTNLPDTVMQAENIGQSPENT